MVIVEMMIIIMTTYGHDSDDYDYDNDDYIDDGDDDSNDDDDNVWYVYIYIHTTLYTKIIDIIMIIYGGDNCDYVMTYGLFSSQAFLKISVDFLCR